MLFNPTTTTLSIMLLSLPYCDTSHRKILSDYARYAVQFTALTLGYQTTLTTFLSRKNNLCEYAHHAFFVHHCKTEISHYAYYAFLTLTSKT